MNKKEINKVLKNVLKFNDPDLDFDVFSLYLLFAEEDSQYDEVKQIENFNVICADSQLGYEGGPEHIYMVLSVKDEINKTEDFIRFNGLYSSYGGDEWNEGFNFVKPKTIKVIEWSKK